MSPGPTLWPAIYDLVAYCAAIGLSPTIITNAQVLAKREVVTRHKEAGIRDFLVSVQGLGPTYDFGADEARPVGLGVRVADPQHFSRHQLKKIHPDDLAWLDR